MSRALFFLIENLLWDYAESRLSKKSIESYRPFPLPSEEERAYNASDVSIIVPTVGFDPQSFSRALISWLANQPAEIIVVTVGRDYPQAKALLNSDAIQEAKRGTEITLLSIIRPNKRRQLIEGVSASTGKIVAFVDDDAFWNPDTLINLLAPFQVPDIGLVGGPIESYLPKDRQDPAVITPYEVAALRLRAKRRGGNKAFYVRDGSTNFTVSGATMLLRAAVVSDPVFQQEFMRETFLGVEQNTGDDAFITRWVLFQHLRADRQGGPQYKLGMQLTPGAQVSTTIMTDGRFVEQMKRWMRTGLRFRLTCVFSDPGLRVFWRTTPYMCRKMVEGLYNPILTLIWFYSFFKVLGTNPLVAMAFALYYLYGHVKGLLAFAREFPYCRRKLWAAFLVDKVSLISDWYCWCTLFTENWASRAGIDSKDEKVWERHLDLDE